MGIGDLVRNATNKATEIVKSEVEKQVDSIRNYPARQAEIKAHLAEQSKMQKVMLQINSGFQQINATSTSTMFQRQDGTVYFNTNFNDRFLFIDYSWSGPMYETMTNSTTNSSGQEVSKRYGVGIVAGSVAGATGKGKKNKRYQSNTSSIQRQTEILTPATLKFKNMDTNTIVSIVIGCNTLIDSQIKGMQIIKEQSVREASDDATDALKGIKALKELLDMGAITQDEFEQKKKQLLGLE